MKAFFSKLHLGSSTTSKPSTPSPSEKDLPAVIQKEKFPPLRQWPPPDQVQRSSSQSSSTSNSQHSHNSYSVFKPLPEVIPKELASQLLEKEKDREDMTPTPTASSPHPVRKTATNGSLNSDVQKKVAFLSPPQTPTPQLDTVSEAEPTSGSPVPPLKTNVSRFQATHGTGAAKSPPRTSSLGGPSSSKTDVRTGSPYTSPQTPYSASAQSLRSGAGTPYSQMSGMSGMSGTTASGSRILAATSWSEVTEEDLVSNLGSRERTRQEVLFEIISSEERYVQELAKMKETFIEPLLHPYSSTPSRVVSPISSTPNLDSYDYDYRRAESPTGVESTDHLPPIAARFMSPTPSNRQRDPKDSTPNIDGESMDTDDEDEKGGRYKHNAAKHNHPRSPYRASQTPNKKNVPFPTRSHHSLPPPPRGNPNTVSTQSLGRQSVILEHERERAHSQSTAGHNTNTAARGMLRKLRKDSNTTKENANADVLGDAVPPAHLPEDLRICLEVIDSGGVFDGHKRLSEALKKRYDDQYPLVRSLADVFVANSDIFHGYATYVLHLERALEQVDNALSTANPSSSTSSKSKSVTKPPSKSPYPQSTPSSSWPRIVSLLHKLELTAAEKGETGLAITLSKPFQRLLKYPLLFQNLLYHTDPSTYEYESTLQMVAEVESIVRSIEDEKILMEERDRTRDCWARIEGLEKVGGGKGGRVVLPKPSRVLMEERQYVPPGSQSGSPLAKSASMANGTMGNESSSPPPPSALANKPIRGKSSLNFKRLSDALSPSKSSANPSPYSKKDLWLVVFNDVVLLCQRTGTTSLPLVTSTGRADSLPELTSKKGVKDGKGDKDGTKGRRGSFTKPRNLYKFVKIENWAMGEALGSVSGSGGGVREGVVSMEDMVRSRTQQLSSQPRIVPMPDDDSDVPNENGAVNGDDSDDDSDDSDRKSKMSFSYWGADKVTVQKPTKSTVVRPGMAGTRGTRSTRGVRVVPTRRGGAGGSGISTSPAYARESSANAKFGTRLVSGESNGHGHHGSGHGHARPASRKTGGAASTTGRTTPTSRPRPSAASATSHSAQSNTNSSPGAGANSEDTKATVTRPGWNSNTSTSTTRAPKMSTSASAGASVGLSSTGARSRNVSQTGSTRSPMPVASSSSAGKEKALSPAPSEDSGVGFYKHYIAKDI
ncbi:hypothetical protein GYMLUDRAFT_74229 [Collybiopsis luxurians FD-317 M1]|uniref:DH domain-containing protein n=1 Tax=Collybiopsis luxurians FD-317 M1 TaxID=944289 RepID=A0A0D0CV20_9AGAR|nr:hypothetical protein GYMLUDRAFT_74229 [Collybiopsis luxurians FD-317 M1]